MMRDVWGLTVVEFIAIKRNLENISDTWSDLWAMLYLSQAKPGQLLGAKFDDVSHDILVLSATKGLRERCIALKPGVKEFSTPAGRSILKMCFCFRAIHIVPRQLQDR